MEKNKNKMGNIENIGFVVTKKSFFITSDDELEKDKELYDSLFPKKEIENQKKNIFSWMDGILKNDSIKKNRKLNTKRKR